MKKAFSLMELMIVIVILGLLAALVMPNLVGKSEQAKQKLVCVQMKSIGQALNSFKLDNGTYPKTEEKLEALVKNLDTDRYTNFLPNGYFENKQTPKDPWGHEYIYIKLDGGFTLISLGADGKENGAGEDKDIKYEECFK
jgi:general secretion pathway protein G